MTDTTGYSPPHKHLVVVGNGMAGHRLVTALMARPDRPPRITVIGEEATTAYNRILLSPWLAGEIDRDSLDLPAPATHGLHWHLGEQVTGIDRTARTLWTDQGTRLDYDRLVLATGARPTLPDIPGIGLGNIGGFRTLEDSHWLMQRTAGQRAVVVGGGLLGLEAAEGLRKRGVEVTLLQRSDRLMNRQLDVVAASWLKDTLTQRGLTVETGAQLARCEGSADGQVCAVVLADGRRLATDCVIIAAGITPNTELGRLAGLNVNKGICVDGHLTTRDPAIHALGECAEVAGTTVGLVEPIWEQVETLADVLCGHATPAHVPMPSATRLKVAGIDLYSFGAADPAPGVESMTYADPGNGDYRRLLIADDRLVGAVLYGDTTDGPALFRLAQAGTALGAARETLIFGAADATHPLQEVA
ncbi:NAD(P)/FAD-dependent oxidoreductase [Larsenimonas rhizosphaerae]|uniref:NAD(P)/FAD-dependent oxidoreductase n=1 Tax=Larsenimonas rhizosphaerae TaxID=2944682 RepID=UPI0020337809|nr:FAD-dependent oxidoreductase [Larsenimonas rhizosphaerae]MCM2129427.1 FAD-dependent oxidoreductase [Larsenimonas rhizosphaerae]